MKNPLLVLSLLAVLLFAASCSSAGAGGDGANANATITGTITVADAAYWPNVKMSLFSDEDAALAATIDGDGTRGVRQYRLDYDSTTTDSTFLLNPTTGFDLSLGAIDGLSRSYALELPSLTADNNREYFPVAWYDQDSDGKLTIATSSGTSTTEFDYSRLPYKTIAVSGGTGTAEHAVTFITQEFDASALAGSGKAAARSAGDATGLYKFVLSDGDSSGTEIDASNNGGFDFEISATSGL